MDDEQERLVIAVSVGAGCMLVFVAIVLTVLLCRHRRCRHDDNLDRHLVGPQSVMSDGRYSSRSPESHRGNHRHHVFAKKEQSNSSALSGFVYKPKHMDRLRNNGKSGHVNKGYQKNTVRSHKSSRSLPVMANVGNYRMDRSPSPPHFNHSAYDFSIPKAPAVRSMYEYRHNMPSGGKHAAHGFTRTRLPSSEQISFASDGRFVVPGSHQSQFSSPHNNQYSQQIPTQPNYPQQFHLKNSDFYTPGQAAAYARYMNGTIERAAYESEWSENRPYRTSDSSDTGQYYSSVGAVFDRNMYRT